MLAQAKNKETMQNQSRQLWNAIEEIAHSRKMSLSKLARSCGFDATAFNKSKWTRKNGAPSFPNTKTICAILGTLSLTWSDFARYVEKAGEQSE